MDVKLPVKTLHSSSYAAIATDRPEVSTRGRSAVITGGGSGLGASIAESFARSGISHLALLGRTEATLLATKEKLLAISPETKVYTYIADVVDAEATARALDAFAAALDGRGIDVLVANAGVIGDLASVAEVKPDAWWKAHEVNVRGNFNLLQSFDRHAAPTARIVHMSTAAVHIPYIPGYSAYRTSKLAATRLFDYYGWEHPDRRVVHMHPGLVHTPATEPIAESLKDVPGLVWDDAQLGADFAVWLVSDEAEFLKGRFVWATWDVDELKALKADLEADATKLTIGLLV